MIPHALVGIAIGWLAAWKISDVITAVLNYQRDIAQECERRRRVRRTGKRRWSITFEQADGRPYHVDVECRRDENPFEIAHAIADASGIRLTGRGSGSSEGEPIPGKYPRVVDRFIEWYADR